MPDSSGGEATAYDLQSDDSDPLPRLDNGRNGTSMSCREMAWFGPDERGPEVFRFLNVVESEQVTLAVRDSLAWQIGEVMRDALASDAPR